MNRKPSNAFNRRLKKISMQVTNLFEYMLQVVREEIVAGSGHFQLDVYQVNFLNIVDVVPQT